MKKVNNIIPYISIALISFISSLSMRSSLFTNILPGHDSSMFLYFGYGMDRGLNMYVDIFDHKGPVLFFINYLAVILGKYGLFIVEYVTFFIFFFYVYKTARIWINNVIVITMIMFLLVFPISTIYEGGNFSESYAVPLIMLALYIFSKYFEGNKIDKKDIIFLGIAFSMVFLLRANMVSVWIVFIFVILCHLIYKKHYKKIFHYTLYFTLGVGIIFLPIFIYLLMKNALSESIYQIFTFNYIYIADVGSISWISIIEYLFFRTEILILTILLGVHFMLNKISWYEVSIYLSIIITCVSIILSKRAFLHYVIVLVPIIALLLILVLRDLKFENNIFNNLRFVISIIISIIPLYWATLGMIVYMNLTEKNSIVHNVGIFYSWVSSRDQINDSIRDVSDYIKDNTKYEDRIYAHRTSGILYLESERLANTKYFNLPGADITNNEKIKSEFFNDMNSNPAKIIILNRDFIDLEQEGFEQEFKEYINENYILDFENEVYLAYKQK